MTTPIIYKWTGEAMVPLGRFHNLCASEFETGKVYRLAEVGERSLKSHQHYFAAVKDGWLNLPEEYAQEFSSPDHLRKWCLIKAGWHHKETIALSSQEDALRVAAYARRHNEFAVVTAKESVVTVYTAMSQSYRGMGKEKFQKSKTDVLDLIDDMLGIERGQTAANAGQAA